MSASTVPDSSHGAEGGPDRGEQRHFHIARTAAARIVHIYRRIGYQAAEGGCKCHIVRSVRWKRIADASSAVHELVVDRSRA